MWLCRFESPMGEPYITMVLSSSVASPSEMSFSFWRKYGTMLTWYVLILAKSRTFFSFPPWCDAGWKAASTPLFG